MESSQVGMMLTANVAMMVLATAPATRLSDRMPSLSPLILDSVSNEERAHALAGRQMAQDLGALLGASSMGFVANAFGIPTSMQVVAAMQFASAGFFALRVPRFPAVHKRE